ncbi:MAG: twin-arginine translocase TatA/TatE family subunit [Candidatus Paceibacterota bacterium]
MFGIGTKELIIIAIILVLLFGAKKIPDLARGIGDAVRHLRKAAKGEEETKEETKNDLNQ